LAGWVTESNVIPKNRYSGFFNTDLAERLADLRPDKIIVCGVCTDICVMHTTSDARNRDYVVEVPTECVASFDSNAHRWALDHIEKSLGHRWSSPTARLGGVCYYRPICAPPRWGSAPGPA
jgi:nicotinamidase-related amidase